MLSETTVNRVTLSLRGVDHVELQTWHKDLCALRCELCGAKDTWTCKGLSDLALTLRDAVRYSVVRANEEVFEQEW